MFVKKRIAAMLCLLILVLAVPVNAQAAAMPSAQEITEEAAQPSPELDITMLLNRYHPLPANFEPVGLVRMKQYNKSGNLTLRKSTIQIYEEAAVALNEMMLGAKAEGLRGFYLDNSYRSTALQLSMFQRKQRKQASYGMDPAVPIKTAIPRTSEHEVGLAIDISCNKRRAMDAAFARTEHGTWLRENSYKYGYILRYPEGKEHITGIVSEPWHYRYVGVTLATLLYENGWVLEEYYSQLAAGKIEPLPA